MNIVIMGAGAVGGYFGGRLSAAGVPVTFLVRERRYRQLSKNGLHVKSVHGDFKVEPTLASSTAEISNPSVVIVALKGYHLQGALPELRALVEKGAVILPLLNGISHLDVLVSEFGKESVVGGVCYIEATLDEMGDVIHTSPMHDIIFGALADTQRPLLDELENLFGQCGVNVKQSQSITVDMWQKFIFLTSFSAITAAARKPIGAILEDDVAAAFLQDMVQEIVSVAQAHNAGLPSDAFDAVMNKMRSVSPSMTSSLHRDLEKRLPLEIDSLQGSILVFAKANGLSTPCVRSVYALLHPHRDGQP